MGQVDSYCQFEVISLAAKSLSVLADEVVLDLSDFGILTDFLDTLCLTSTAKREILTAIGEKNVHDLERICVDAGVEPEDVAALKQLVQLYGAPKSVLPGLREVLREKIDTAKIDSLELLCDNLCKCGFEDMIRVDFSIVNGLDYYNGIVFKGFVKGIPSAVLSGGQYDGLMKKMERNSGAIGFAVYLDLMEDLLIEKKEFDVDAIVLYNDSVSFLEVDSVLKKMIAEGKNVMAQKSVPSKIKFKELWSLTEGGVKLLERNA